ncbi:MAG: methyltransferase [Candidatus Heimdallarchaeota archaeon]|nr:methyltransferase [Candidatus Heimdallarchaeota archaeon]
MKRKELEITLSRNVHQFPEPKIDLEQYLTPARVAANLLHRAHQYNDIEGKKVLDSCAGTGILGIGAALLGAQVTALEVDELAINKLNESCELMDLDINVIHTDLFSWQNCDIFDTILMNPPFGINQKKHRDMDFVQHISDVGNILYTIHDGSLSNQKSLSKIYAQKGLEILETYLDDFPLQQSYPWHVYQNKRYQVLVIRSRKA